MRTFVINLEGAIERKQYMQQLLKEQGIFKPKYIAAIDGRLMDQDERSQRFDENKFRNYYMRNVRPGEIGCTLSHQTCYKDLLDSTDEYILILEDDVVVQESLNKVMNMIESYMNTDIPTVVLLSGWFWYSSRKKIDSNHYLANVVDAYLTHGYAINKSAAKRMIDEYPYYLADDWDMFRKRGIRILGMIPHPLDQDWSGVFKSTINDRELKLQAFNLKRWVQIKKRMLIQRILKLFNHFEPAMDIDSRINNLV